jgi:tetratricopeptide (TPR) repeat protein
MKQTAETLQRLSPLLDQALDLDESERETWLAGLSDEHADLVPLLRTLLAGTATKETGDLLARRPDLAALDIETEDVAEFDVDDKVGPYRLLRELGRGGMGEVWLADRIDGALKRSVALKLPVLNMRRSVLIQRFERERDILGGLAHPNIARLYDAGLAEDGQPYLALEYVDGQTIIDYAEQHALDSKARVRLLRQVMGAVQYAHANLVIHRDLKPSNVIVTNDGNALLLDFGIAKLLEGEAVQAQETELTQVGGKALTLHYAAPEQIFGKPISIATDVWALGVLLYELTTGKRPFAAADRNALEHAVLEDDPVRPSRCRSGCMASLASGLAADIDTIILKALKKLPAERYPTVSAFADDLDRWLRGEPVMAQKDSAWYRGRKFVGRHRWAVIAAGAALVALGGFTASLDAQVRKVTRERDRADRLAEFMTASFKVADPSEERSGRVTARELLDAAVRNLDSDLPADPALRARFVRTMGRAYSGLGALAQSEALLRKEYDRARHDLGDNDPAVLALGSELVSVLSIRWQSAEAETLARDILLRQRTVLGNDNPDTAATESYLAYILSVQGRFDEAVELGRHSLEVARRHAPADNAGILEEEASIAYYMLKSGKGDPREAEGVFRRLVAVYTAKFGPGNPKTLQATNGLAAVLAKQRRFDEEEPLLRQALQNGRKDLGPEHPRMLDLLNNLAAALINKGDLDQAEPVLKESIAINQHIEGPESPRAAMAKYNLACVEARRGKQGVALVLLADALNHGLIPDAALEMEGEEDLISLRGDPRFLALVATAKKRYGSHGTNHL